MGMCINCGKKESQYVQDFLIVSRSCVGDYGGTLTTTTERLSGAERHAVCRACLLKRITKRALLTAVAVMFAVFLGGGILFGNDAYKPIGPIIALSIVLGLAAGIAVETSGLFSRKRRAGYLKDFAWEHAGHSNTDKIYFPVGEGLYKNKDSFLASGAQLFTDIGTRLYSELISNGVWKDYIAAALILADVQAGTIQMANVPEGEHKMLLTECVQELLRLYRQTPGGFLTDSAAAQPVRVIGKKLDEAGGFELMLQAHELFAANSPGMGLARNLEMVWDGIGGWRG